MMPVFHGQKYPETSTECTLCSSGKEDCVPLCQDNIELRIYSIGGQNLGDVLLGFNLENPLLGKEGFHGLMVFWKI